jgi:hypothetical protein
MLHLGIVFINKLKLCSFHGIDFKILLKGIRTIQNSLANLQGQRSTSFAIVQTHWHTQELTLCCLLLGDETKQKILFMLVFVLQFCFGLNFRCVLFWFFIFGIINHIAILGMLVVTLYYTPSNLPFIFELYVDSKILWKFATKQPFMITNLNWNINFPTVTWPFTFQFNKQLNIMWMILLFKACYEFGAHCLCHCATSFLKTLDPKTTPMYPRRTHKSYYCLHNINENITKWMEQLVRRRGKRLC